MTPEGKVKSDCKKLLDAIGAYHFWPVQTGYGAATIDVLVCWRGVFFGFEMKRPDEKGLARGKLTKRQEMTLQKIKAAGGEIAIIKSAAQMAAHLGLSENEQMTDFWMGSSGHD